MDLSALCLLSVYTSHTSSRRQNHSQRMLSNNLTTCSPIAKRLNGKFHHHHVIIMGDLNCELQHNVENYTGKWLMTTRPDQQTKDTAISYYLWYTLMTCLPLTLTVCLAPKRNGWSTQRTEKICNATYLQKDVELRPKKLDYFPVSNRWKSSVLNPRTNWGPSVHRFGRSFDHRMLQITWKWRVTQESQNNSH